MLTQEQKNEVLAYVQWRIERMGKVPKARYEFVTLPTGEKVALPSEQSIGEVTIDGKVVGVRTDKQGKLVYGSKVNPNGRKSRTAMPEELAKRFVAAFGDLLKVVKEE